MIRRVYRYLTNLEWTEKIQHTCIFCDRSKLVKIVYEVSNLILLTRRTKLMKVKRMMRSSRSRTAGSQASCTGSSCRRATRYGTSRV